MYWSLINHKEGRGLNLVILVFQNSREWQLGDASQFLYKVSPRAGLFCSRLKKMAFVYYLSR